MRSGIFNTEYITFFITMIVGGLAYSIISFSYMHEKFEAKETMVETSKRLDRLEDRIEKRLESIENKLDGLKRGN